MVKDCSPHRCGRVVNDGLINNQEAHALLKLAKKGLAKGGSNGGASIVDLHSGALSTGKNFVNVYKTYPELYEPEDFLVYITVKKKVKAYIAEHFEIDPESLYLTHPTFFSRLESKPAETVHDEYWHVHVGTRPMSSLHNVNKQLFFLEKCKQTAVKSRLDMGHVPVDKETYPSFHYTSLIYLTDLGEDFEGGQFVFVDAHEKLNRYIPT